MQERAGRYRPRRSILNRTVADISKQLRDQEFRNIILKLKAGKTLTARESALANEYAQEAGGGKRYLTGREIGKLLGISRQAGDMKVKQGCLVRSFDELVAWEAKRNDEGRGGKSLNAVRQRKLEIETERLEFLFAIDRGEYVSIAAIEEAGVAAGAALSAELNLMGNDLPGQLAGLDERQIRTRLLARVDEVLASFRKRMKDLRSERKRNEPDLQSP
jgi:hypothetical protein